VTKDPNLFKPRRRDYGAHDQKHAKSPWEWWYFDLISDNGYSIVNIWLMPVTPKERAPYGSVSLDISHPDGKHTMLEASLEKKDVSVSYDHCDVTAGRNYVRGEWPRFELHCQYDDVTLDVVFESITQGVMEPPNGCFIGRDLPPATKTYMGWVITMPRAKVTGTLTLGGKKIALSGLGYHDHQWGSVDLVKGLLMEDGHIFDYWYWGRIHLPKHTLVYWDGQLRPELGSGRHKRLVVLEGDKLVDYLTDGIYTDVAEIETDPVSGIDYHRTLVMAIDSDTINGRLTMRPKGDLGKWLFPPRSGYVRYICDCEASLEVMGKKVEATVGMTNELIFLNNRD
jgi:hypothetical protein